MDDIEEEVVCTLLDVMEAAMVLLMIIREYIQQSVIGHPRLPSASP